MLKTIRELNDKYDKLPEPKRIIVFMCPIIVAILVNMIAYPLGWFIFLGAAAFRIIGMKY